MRRLQAVVFDLDDTLYPERQYVYSGFRAVAIWAEAHLGVSQDVALKALWQLFCEGTRGNTFDQWLSSLGVAPQVWVPHMVKVYREHQPRIEPFQDTLDLLPRLRQLYRLGLVTDGRVHVQQGKLEALRLVSYFDVIVFSDALGEEARKPSTRPFEAVLERLGLTGPEAVYVGDNPLKDFFGARAVGMWTVRVRRPDGLYSKASPPSADHAPHTEVTSLRDLEKALAQVEGMSRRNPEGVERDV